MRVGFVGLGNVGAKLAGSLLRGPDELILCDLDAEKRAQFEARGAKVSRDIAPHFTQIDVLITCLPSPAASNAVLSALIPHWREGQIWIEMSTTDAEEVSRLGKLIDERGGLAADCPVSGGCHRAESGNISIFAGCDRPCFENIFPLLALMGRNILHTGPLGSASILKVITNYLATANLVSCTEALTVAKGAGLDLGTAYEAIRISSGTSFVHETESQVILNGSRDISFTMDLVAKDIGIFQAVADRAQVPLEINPLLIRIFQDGISRFGARERSPNIIKRLEEQTGLCVQAQGFPEKMTDMSEPEMGKEIPANHASPFASS